MFPLSSSFIFNTFLFLFFFFLESFMYFFHLFCWYFPPLFIFSLFLFLIPEWMKFPYSPELPCNHGNAGCENMAPWDSISALVPPALHPPPSPPSSVLFLPTPLRHPTLTPSLLPPTPHLLLLQGSDRKLALASSSTAERDTAGTMSRTPSLQKNPSH